MHRVQILLVKGGTEAVVSGCTHRMAASNEERAQVAAAAAPASIAAAPTATAAAEVCVRRARALLLQRHACSHMCFGTRMLQTRERRESDGPVFHDDDDASSASSSAAAGLQLAPAAAAEPAVDFAGSACAITPFTPAAAAQIEQQGAAMAGKGPLPLKSCSTLFV